MCKSKEHTILHTKAMSQFFIQIYLGAEIGGCEVRNRFYLDFGEFSMNFKVNLRSAFQDRFWNDILFFHGFEMGPKNVGS